MSRSSDLILAVFLPLSQVDWKLTRGKWRPRLLDFAKAADTDQLGDCSRRAIALLDKHCEKGEAPPPEAIKEALKALSELKGTLCMLRVLCMLCCTHHAPTLPTLPSSPLRRSSEGFHASIHPSVQGLGLPLPRLSLPPMTGA
jgi:hypothetical protein